jgi:hypothetical protein
MHGKEQEPVLMAVIGLICFIFIKETNVNEEVDAQSLNMNLREILLVLIKNKYF